MYFDLISARGDDGNYDRPSGSFVEPAHLGIPGRGRQWVVGFQLFRTASVEICGSISLYVLSPRNKRTST